MYTSTISTLLDELIPCQTLEDAILLKTYIISSLNGDSLISFIVFIIHDTWKWIMDAMAYDYDVHDDAQLLIRR